MCLLSPAYYLPSTWPLREFHSAVSFPAMESGVESALMLPVPALSVE